MTAHPASRPAAAACPTLTLAAARPASASAGAHAAKTLMNRPASAAARPASTLTNCTVTFGRDWKDSMAGYLTQFLINGSRYSFRAFGDSKETGNIPKQVKGKLKDVFTFAWSLANDKQREIMNRPLVDEANRYEYPAYVSTLSTVCDELASAVFQVAIIDHPLPPPPPVNPYKNGKKTTRAPVNKAPTHYKHLKVSYAYNRIQKMKQGLVVAATAAAVVPAATSAVVMAPTMAAVAMTVDEHEKEGEDEHAEEVEVEEEY